jgi:hypothetical protein
MNYGNFKTQNISNLFAGLIGIGIGILILSYTMAQWNNNTGNSTVEWETYKVWTVTTEKIAEEWTWVKEIWTRSTVKLIEPSNRVESWGDKPVEETDKGWNKFILRTDNKVVLVKWFPEDSMATKIATYAYKVSNWDMDFLMTLKAENWWFDMYKQSNVIDKNWVREDSWGLCQLHRRWHKDIVDAREFWESYEYQVEQCWNKYSWWTKFYGYNVRLKFKNDFTILDK